MSSMPRPIKRIFSSPTKTVFRRALYGIPMAMGLAAFLLAGNTVLTRINKGTGQLPQTINQHIVSSSLHFQLADPLFAKSQSAQAGKAGLASAMPQQAPSTSSAANALSDCTTATYRELTSRESTLVQRLSQGKIKLKIDPASLPTQLNADALKNLDTTTRAEIVELQTLMAQLQKTARC